MKQESVITIGNRYCNSIKWEIGNTSEQITKDIKTKDFNGFYFHNLAARCEMLVKYCGDKLKELGFNWLIEQISLYGENARTIQEYINKTNGLKNCDSQKVKQFENVIISFNDDIQKIVPSLFFIV